MHLRNKHWKRPNPLDRRPSRGSHLFLWNINPHCLISDFVRSALISRRIVVVSRAPPISCCAPLTRTIRPIEDLLFRRVVTTAVQVTETRLALVVRAALHTQAAIGAALAQTPVAVLICIAVLRVRAGVTAGIEGRGEPADWDAFLAESCLGVRMALTVNGAVGYGMTGISGWLNSWAFFACLTGSICTFQVLLAGCFAVADVADFTGLRFSGYLANAVFTKEIRATAIDCIAEVSFAAKSARALLWDIWI